MKKIVLGAAALSLMFAASCKKDDKSGPSNSFTVAGATFNPTYIARADAASRTSITGTDQTNSIIVQFNTVPMIGGSFKIVESVSADDEIQITAVTQVNGVKTAYQSIDDAGTANVTINNGKIAITVPGASIKRTDLNTAKSDTVTIAATLAE